MATHPTTYNSLRAQFVSTPPPPGSSAQEMEMHALIRDFEQDFNTGSINERWDIKPNSGIVPVPEHIRNKMDRSQ